MARIDATKLGDYIREQRTAAEISLRQLAKTAGVSNPYLSQVERGLRRPSAEILSRIAAGLRISVETLYIRAGMLEERRGSEDVLAAIAGDETLTERQRKVLLEIYAAFQAENAARGAEQPDGDGRWESTNPPSAHPQGAGAEGSHTEGDPSSEAEPEVSTRPNAGSEPDRSDAAVADPATAPA